MTKLEYLLMRLNEECSAMAIAVEQVLRYGVTNTDPRVNIPLWTEIERRNGYINVIKNFIDKEYSNGYIGEGYENYPDELAKEIAKDIENLPY